MSTINKENRYFFYFRYFPSQRYKKQKTNREREGETRIPFPFKNKTKTKYSRMFISTFSLEYIGLKINIKY